MKKTAILTAAMFAMTALSTPARADDGLARLGIGLGLSILGEAMKGGGNRQGGAQPRKGDQLIGRVDGKPVKGQKQEPRQTSKKRQAAPADEVAHAPLPAIVPLPEEKPTPEELAAWIADAPEREAAEEMEAQAEAEIAGDLAPIADPTMTTAATTEEATVELRDNSGEYWGKVSPTRAAKADEFTALGMSRADAYRAIGLRGPRADYPEWDGKHELRDENGRYWGRVHVDVAERVAKAVEMGMPASKAIAAIANLADPDEVAAKAKAETDAEEATKAECLDRAKSGDLTHAGIRHLKCGAYQAEIAEIEAQVAADEKAEREAAIAKCIPEYTDPKTKDNPSGDCGWYREEALAAIQKAEADKKAAKDAAYTARIQDAMKQVDDEEAEKVAEAEQKPTVDAESTTAAIDKPKLDVDLDQPAAKAKPKLDVDL